MPTILCPHCTRPATLPDPWPHPSYTCPHCGAVVALSPPAHPAPLPRAEPDDPSPVYFATDRGGAFGTMFRGSMGCLAAVVVAFGVIVFACSGGFSGR